MSVMQPNAYHQLGPFPNANDWHFFQTAYAGGFPPNFPCSPNTSGGSGGSGGSDESMNGRMGGRIDPKRSPKYLEKRAKNNEAAKKSRKNRRDREMGYQQENQEMKKKMEALQIEYDQTLAQLNTMTKQVKDSMNEIDEYKRQLHHLRAIIGENQMLKDENRNLKREIEELKKHSSVELQQPFRDVTNIEIKYEQL